MPSKFESIIPNLKPAPVEDIQRQDKVDMIKAELMINSGGELNAERLGAMYIAARAREDELDELQAKLSLRLEALTQLLIESHEEGSEQWGAYNAEDNTMRMPSGHSISVQVEPRTTIKDSSLARAWWIAIGLADTLQVPWARLNALTKERLMDGQEPPPGTDVYAHTKVVLYKPRKKGAKE
jgi:hypothetical protein